MIDTVVSNARSLWSQAPSFINKANKALESAAVWTGHMETVGKLSAILDYNKKDVMQDWGNKYNNASGWVTELASNATSVASTGSKWVSSHTPSTVSSIASGVRSYAPSLEASTLALGAAALTGFGLAYKYLTGGSKGSESVVTETVEITKASDPTKDNDSIGEDSAEGNTTAQTVKTKGGKRGRQGDNSSSGP